MVEEMKELAGPPDVPAGVFSFLGGKQITISSAAQQRAAALQSSLKQIQEEGANEFLDAPCMQLIAAKPAKQENAPSFAAEGGPSAGADAITGPPADGRAQATDGLNSSGDAGPPDVPAGVFSFLGGKQIIISSAAQQRAAALHSALQQIQEEGADEFLDAPCMQLIAAKPAKQDSAPSFAAEGAPSAGADVSTGPSADGSTQARQGLTGGDQAGLPDVPAGVFSFLGGKQINISITAQQRAAALQSALQQIQEEGADEHLGAPCMQLIKEDREPSTAAEGGPSTHPDASTSAPADEIVQAGEGAIADNAPGPEPAHAAESDGVQKQTAQAMAQCAHQAGTATQPVLEGIAMSSWEETQPVFCTAVVPDTLLDDQPGGVTMELAEDGFEAEGHCDPSNQHKECQQVAEDQAEHVQQTQVLDQPAPVEGVPDSAKDEDLQFHESSGKPTGLEEVGPTLELMIPHQADNKGDLTEEEVSDAAVGEDVQQNQTSVPSTLVMHGAPSVGARLEEMMLDEKASMSAADVLNDAPEAAASDAEADRAASQDAGERGEDQCLHAAALHECAEGSAVVEERGDAAGCEVGAAETLLLEDPCGGSQAAAPSQGGREHAGEETGIADHQTTADAAPAPMDRQDRVSLPHEDAGACATETGYEGWQAGYLSPDNDQRQLSPQQGPQLQPTTITFATASGKAVPVSAAALAQTAALFGSSTMQPGPTAAAPPMFATGSGKPVHIAADKLASAQKLLGFAEDDGGSGQGTSDPADETPMRMPAAEPCPSGWKTGSGRKMEVDPQNLTAARALMSDVIGEAATNVDARSPEKKRFKPAVHDENDAAVCNASMSPLAAKVCNCCAYFSCAHIMPHQANTMQEFCPNHVMREQVNTEYCPFSIASSGRIGAGIPSNSCRPRSHTSRAARSHGTAERISHPRCRAERRSAHIHRQGAARPGQLEGSWEQDGRCAASLFRA